MKASSPQKCYYYFDESGSPEILGRKGINLVDTNKTSKVFMVGFIYTNNPRQIYESLKAIHDGIIEDEYLSSVPSIISTKRMFHANKDCAEVREKVYKTLAELDFGFQCIVARKDLSIFKSVYDLKTSNLYKDMVSKLMINRTHLNQKIDCYFSAMKNVVRKDIMEEAIRVAISDFSERLDVMVATDYRVLVQNASESFQLQAVDYMLWAVFQAYEHHNFRFFNIIKDKVELVVDLFDVRRNSSGEFYTKKNVLSLEKISPS